MNLTVTGEKGVSISNQMMGLFFEDINYAADGGLYAEMIENRSFEFYDCYGDRGDYYVKPDPGYGWWATDTCGCGSMEYVMGSPVDRRNPHYLRFTATAVGQGFANQAYRGIYLQKGKKYPVSFYARTAAYDGDLQITVEKNGQIYAQAEVVCVHTKKESWQKWTHYEILLTAQETAAGADFVIALKQPGTVEFDFISMMPADAVAGVFRKDLFELLKQMHPGFLRFPGGCIVEGNTLENRYRWKESVGPVEGRRANFNRWALHGTKEENGWHTEYAHYNQTLGLGYYEYFLLCDLIGAKPLPVMNVGLACQYQSFELVKMEETAFAEFVQDALDLIEFANGDVTTPYGALRAGMGHPESFHMDRIGIGNEQWQTEAVDFFERYQAFEKAIHEKYPDMKLIGSAGPDVGTQRYTQAWSYYHENCAKNPDFTYAVDEHYYMKPEWFFANNEFYDEYPRDVKVFSGEYAAHPSSGMNQPEANTLMGALAEAAFLTGVERNADVVVLASYAPLFARIGYTQWSPDMIWFDENDVYPSPSYYVQKMYAENMGTRTIPMHGQEKQLRETGLYVNLSWDGDAKEYILKVVNATQEQKTLELTGDGLPANAGTMTIIMLTAERGTQTMPAVQTAGMRPEMAKLDTVKTVYQSTLMLLPESFSVIRFQA